MADKTFVCRCEDVTLAEFQEAVERGSKDLESVKRYTGFGTGWCQGKNCVSLCARLLVRLGGEAPSAPITPRQPLHPVPLSNLAAMLDDEEEPK